MLVYFEMSKTKTSEYDTDLTDETCVVFIYPTTVYNKNKPQRKSLQKYGLIVEGKSLPRHKEIELRPRYCDTNLRNYGCC